MSAPLYNVGDHVRASHVGSEILELAVVDEIVEKWIGHSRRVKPKPETKRQSYKIVGPLYWIRFDVGGMVVPRWQNELVAVTVTEHAT